ncbi:MAG TPA: Crp/Fnr family transcriptional regulator [Gemmatimonadaceae bacterium]|nr:Crp/Fnr family transcriptional regulator [Gemmatimonadaceae bacterium]
MPRDAEPQAEFRNELLRALPPEEQELLAPLLEPVELRYGMVVSDINTPMEYLYFPATGIVSSVSVMADGSAVETATVGREGMAPIAPFLGVTMTPEHLFVQVPGSGHRLRLEAFEQLISRLPTLASLLRRYTVALFTLIAQNSGCNRKHTMVQRCARWIATTNDMVGRDRFEMTHLVLSQMLGVRRASVTESALVLQREGAISYQRGIIEIKDRGALEAQACECYRIIRSTFDRLLGQGAGADPLAEVRLSDHGMTRAGDGAPLEEAEQLG